MRYFIGNWHYFMDFIDFQIFSSFIVPFNVSTISGEVTSYIVSNLYPLTHYMVEVAAIYRQGEGTKSQPIKVMTPGGVPTRPNITLR